VSRAERQERLAESRRRLTKLLIMAALIRYGLQPGDIDIGKVYHDDVDEAANLVKHGSVHVPVVLVNVKQIERFERFVPAWSRLAVETGVLDVLAMFESGEIIIGLPEGSEKHCVVIPSSIAQEFETLKS